MKFPEVIHQLCNKITVLTIHMLLSILCHLWVSKRRTPVSVRIISQLTSKLFHCKWKVKSIFFWLWQKSSLFVICSHKNTYKTFYSMPTFFITRKASYPSHGAMILFLWNAPSCWVSWSQWSGQWLQVFGRHQGLALSLPGCNYSDTAQHCSARTGPEENRGRDSGSREY